MRQTRAHKLVIDEIQTYMKIIREQIINGKTSQHYSAKQLNQGKE